MHFYMKLSVSAHSCSVVRLVLSGKPELASVNCIMLPFPVKTTFLVLVNLLNTVNDEAQDTTVSELQDSKGSV